MFINYDTYKYITEEKDVLLMRLKPQQFLSCKDTISRL